MGLFSKMKEAQQQAQQAAGQNGGLGAATGMGDMGAQAAYAQTAQRLAQSGVEAPGVIHSMTPTGKTDFGGGQQIAFDVSFRPEGGEPVQTTITQSMLPAQLSGLSDGKTITVRFDPASPTTALIYGW
jgi:hypothetical protein